MKYIIIMYDDFQIGLNEALRVLAIKTENIIIDDGHQLEYVDGDGFLTYVMFDTIEDMTIFKLKYMAYHFEISPWFLGHYLYPKTAEIEFPISWCKHDQSWVPAAELFDRWPTMKVISIPRHMLDDMVIKARLDLILEHKGRVVIYKNGGDPMLGGPVTYDFKLAFPDEGQAMMFKLKSYDT